MTSSVLLEVCIDSIKSGIAAEKGGANRIELCAALSEGGLTPTAGFLRTVKRTLKIPIYCMIRPRSGDFVYSEKDLEVMKADIEVLKENGADGFVFGILTQEAEVDLEKCKTMLQTTKPLPVTFHRAFDQVVDPLKATREIIELGFERILTSGQASSAEGGVQTIQQMVELAAGRIQIMAGAGVNPGNVAAIIANTGVREIHASARKLIKSEMKHGHITATMGKDADDMLRYETDDFLVSQIVKCANKSE